MPTTSVIDSNVDRIGRLLEEDASPISWQVVEVEEEVEVGCEGKKLSLSDIFSGWVSGGETTLANLFRSSFSFSVVGIWIELSADDTPGKQTISIDCYLDTTMIRTNDMFLY